MARYYFICLYYSRKPFIFNIFRAVASASAAAATATGKAALFIPLVIAASLFQYSRFARFRQPAFCGRFARRAGPHKTQSENPAAGR